MTKYTQHLILSIFVFIVSCETQENKVPMTVTQSFDLNLNFHDNIQELNPFLASNQTEKYISELLYDRLINDDYSSDVFTSYTYDSINYAYTFVINANKKFHNGRKLNTESIKDYFKYITKHHYENSSVQSFISSLDGYPIVRWYRENRNVLDSIPRGFQILNDSTFTIHLDQNHTDLPIWLMDFQFFTIDNQKIVGSGPFRLNNLNEDISAQLSKFSLNKNGINAINLSFIKNNDLEIEEFFRGSLDLISYNSSNYKSNANNKIHNIINSKYPSYQVKKSDVALIRYAEINQIYDSALLNKTLACFDKEILNTNFILLKKREMDSLKNYYDSTTFEIPWTSKLMNDSMNYFSSSDFLSFIQTNVENINPSEPHIVIKEITLNNFQSIDEKSDKIWIENRLQSSNQSTILVLDVISGYVIYNNRLKGIDDYMSLSEMTKSCYFQKPQTF